jgi:hypothetical protein
MTRDEWDSMDEEGRFNAYNRVEEQLLSLGEQVAELRQKVYLLRKILKWKGEVSKEREDT